MVRGEGVGRGEAGDGCASEQVILLGGRVLGGGVFRMSPLPFPVLRMGLPAAGGRPGSEGQGHGVGLRASLSDKLPGDAATSMQTTLLAAVA